MILIEQNMTFTLDERPPLYFLIIFAREHYSDRIYDGFAIYCVKILPKMLAGHFQILQNPSKIAPKSISDTTKDLLGSTLDSSSKKV